jgi:hypothetical protein
MNRKKRLYEKWWFWLLIVIILISIVGVAAQRIETKTITETEIVECEEERITDSTIAKGEEVIERECVTGEKAVTYKVTLTNDWGTKREKISEKTVVEPIHRIVKVGTKEEPAGTTTTTNTGGQSTQSAPAATQSAYYANCTAAKDAGVAPIYEGQPGYRSALDRDHDGIACE